MFRRPADPFHDVAAATHTDEWEPGARHTPPSHTKSSSDPGAPLWMHSPGCRPEPLLVLELSVPTKSPNVYGATDPFGPRCLRQASQERLTLIDRDLNWTRQNPPVDGF